MSETGRARGKGAALLLRLLVVCLALQSLAGPALACCVAALEMSGTNEQHALFGGTGCPGAAAVDRAHAEPPGREGATGPAAAGETPALPLIGADACTTMLCCYGDPMLAETGPGDRHLGSLTRHPADATSPASALAFSIKRPPRLT